MNSKQSNHKDRRDFFKYAGAAVAGLAIGAAGSYATPKPAPEGKPFKVAVIDTEHFNLGFDKKFGGLLYLIVDETDTGSVELFRLEPFSENVGLHKHPKENHVVYVLRGRAQITIVNVTYLAEREQMYVIPKGVPHKLESLGFEPFDFIVFSTPPFREDDVTWL